MVFVIDDQYGISRSLFEVYKTDEENFIPYTPTGSVSNNNSDSQEEDESNNEGFTLHQGEIQETYFYGNMFKTEHDYDYEDISNNGSISFPSIDKKRFYKGVRTCLLKSIESYNRTAYYEDMVEVMLGFITEQTFNSKGVDLKISGMTKLLDRKYQFDFTQMKRSVIVEEIIKTAGLTPVVDFTGMADDVIDYSNAGSDDDSVSTSGIGESIKSLVKKITKGIKTDLGKAKAIHEWLRQNLTYNLHSCSRYSTPEECLAHKNDLNCADTSRLTCAMMTAAKLNATVVHGPNHFWTVITINGVEYASDATSKYREWNTVWQGMSYYNKCGSAPSC